MTIRITVPESVLFRDLGGEAVILELDEGHYFGLDETGTRMWQLLEEHGHPEPVVRELLSEFDVEEARLREDLKVFVDTLAAKRLVELHED